MENKLNLLRCIYALAIFVGKSSCFVPNSLPKLSPRTVNSNVGPNARQGGVLLHANKKFSGRDAHDRNVARTCIQNFLTQRSIQSFMFICQQCRDPHTVSWLEKFSGAGNLLEFHGTGGLNMTRFEKWDSFFMQMLERPAEVLIVAAKRRGRGHGGWSKNNPYLEERFVEFEIDINPTSLASRMISVREQIAQEWVDDLDVVAKCTTLILGSYFDVPVELENVDISNGDQPFHFGMTMLRNKNAFQEHISSPIRGGSFDLLLLLTTHESIHRVLRDLQFGTGQAELSFEWLREFFEERLESHFDGNQLYGRGDDFIEELLKVDPFNKQMKNRKMGIINPKSIAEKILRTRSDIAQEWKEDMTKIADTHLSLRRALLSSQMDSWGSSQSAAAAAEVEESVFD